MNTYLTYALNKEGKLVHIDSVPNGNDCGCVCPACKMPLQAKNAGLINKHHFAHQSGVDCPGALETMIHMLAKEKIQKAFYENENLNIELEYVTHCINEKTCKFAKYDNCLKTDDKPPYNLKDFYDTCEQEICYDGINRRSDLKIWSKKKPDRKPIYIEIFVTHQSDMTKLHSGAKIIEVKIENEEDIDEIIQYGFVNRNNAPATYFYNFEISDNKNTGLKQKIVFYRYILYASGKTQCYRDSCLCNELKRARPNSIYELCFHTLNAFSIYDIAKWVGYRKYGIKNCMLCKNYVDRYDGVGKICRLYKKHGFINIGLHNTARAVDCSTFVVDEQEMNKCLNDYDNDYIKIVTEFD